MAGGFAIELAVGRRIRNHERPPRPRLPRPPPGGSG
ncbi:hypothetical protein [Streptomyces fagopyri]